MAIKKVNSKPSTLNIKLSPVKDYINTDLGIDGFLMDMVKIIQELHVKSGTKAMPANENLLLTAELICSQIIENYSYFRFEEIRACFDLGITEEFGEYFGINYKSLVFFLKSYKQSKYRTEYIKSIRVENVKQLPQMTETQKENDAKEAAIRKFNEYKSGSILKDWGSATYDYLEKSRIIELSLPEKQQIAAILADVKTRKVKSNKLREGKVVCIGEKLDSFEGMNERSKLKLLVLECLFDGYIKQEKHIKDTVIDGLVVNIDLISIIKEKYKK